MNKNSLPFTPLSWDPYLLPWSSGTEDNRNTLFTGTYPVPVDEYKYGCTTLHLWRSEDNLACLSSPSTLFETESLYCTSCIFQANGQLAWSTSFREFCCFCLLSHHRSAGLTGAHSHSLRRVGSRYFNTGSHSCTTSTALYPVSHLPGSIAQGSLISNPHRFLSLCMAGCVFDMCINEQRSSWH